MTSTLFDKNDGFMAKTIEAFDNPQVGMRFSEMYSWWLYILAVLPNGIIITMDQHHKYDCGWKLNVFASKEAFQKEYRYSSRPDLGYPCLFCDMDEKTIKNANNWIKELLSGGEQTHLTELESKLIGALV